MVVKTQLAIMIQLFYYWCDNSEMQC